MRMRSNRTLLAFVLAFSTFLAQASDWPTWRGPGQNGVSSETGLISSWSLEGENLLWKSDFIGRSTPVILNGRVYVIGRAGEGINKQERVACFDAESGKLLWEHRLNVFLTTVPFPRVGWANLTGDPETGNIYAHGVAGLFVCFDGDGKVIWQHSLTEEFGRMAGYGGRTHTPAVDGDLVILSLINSNWGDQAAPRHRYFAFDKHSGEVIWVSTPGGRPYDLNTYSTPVIAAINGQRLLIGGNADGAIYALKVQTGEKVWGFKLSKRGINSSVVVDGTRVYASHSEENLDEANMGRLVCIDGTGSGDVTRTHELWRYNQLKAGFASPTVHQGRVYVIDNSANLHCLDATNGKVYWKYNLGTVGKGSPVWADGKLYTTELNGAFNILRPGAAECESLDEVIIPLGNRTAEIYSSPAIAYRRVFFATEDGLYCLGKKDSPFSLSASSLPSSSDSKPGPQQSSPAHLQIVPAEVITGPGETVQFRVRAYDTQARFLGEVDAKWSQSGLSGQLDQAGRFRPEPSAQHQAGKVLAKVGGLEASARLRVMPDLPWQEDFEIMEVGKIPTHWIGAAGRFSVQLKDGNRVLSKPFVRRGIQRSYVYIGPSDLKNYTMQADLMGTKDGRRIPDMGLIANRYVLALMGARQQLHVHSWASELRMARSADFPWQPNIWYTMKMRVDVEGNKAVVRGKVWPKTETEPEAWSIVVEDPLPNREGTPGLFGQSYAEIFYDNIKVSKSEP
ncbi:PQQ-like beta-propeller repeat protein [Acidobacteria bacterium AH-259-G07]|nr:PQQ-like beta-propeller repeat protein [Acidobacteria bacterium AH-259-G07]